MNYFHFSSEHKTSFHICKLFSLHLQIHGHYSCRHDKDDTRKILKKRSVIIMNN